MVCIRDSLQNEGTYRLKVKEWKKIFFTKENQKKAGVVISDKIGFRGKNITRDNKGRFTMVKELIH